MMSLALLFLLLAGVFTIGSAMGKLPLWPACMFLIVIHLMK